MKTNLVFDEDIKDKINEFANSFAWYIPAFVLVVELVVVSALMIHF